MLSQPLFFFFSDGQFVFKEAMVMAKAKSQKFKETQD